MRLLLATFIICLFATNTFSQKLKYKADIEPLLKGNHTMHSVPKLSMYFDQNMEKNGTPTDQARQYLLKTLSDVCIHIGHTYKKQAYSLVSYLTTDTAIATLNIAIEWYQKIPNVLNVKNDTLANFIVKLEKEKKQWIHDRQKTLNEIKIIKENIQSTILRITPLSQEKADEISERTKNAVIPIELKQIEVDAKDILSDLEREERIKEERMKAAEERRQMVYQQREKEENQKEFLRLQELCRKENTCPNCPIEVAKQFRDAYFSGDIKKIKTLIIDYYGNGELFYEKNIDLFKNLSSEEINKLSAQFKANTADYKRTDPENVVYYSDVDGKDFHIDRNYKSSLLHATVFQAINQHDKIDLVKYQGKWKIYRVGGAYGGRTGSTIVTGKFFFDPRFLQKEIKTKKK